MENIKISKEDIKLYCSSPIFETDNKVRVIFNNIESVVFILEDKEYILNTELFKKLLIEIGAEERQ